jgi:hypothetical protein
LTAADETKKLTAMTEEMLKAVLDAAHTKAEKDGTATMPEGRTLTLYAGHTGVSLPIAKVESVRVKSGVVSARTTKGETFVVALADVFAASIDGGGSGSSSGGRKAGFLG